MNEWKKLKWPQLGKSKGRGTGLGWEKGWGWGRGISSIGQETSNRGGISSWSANIYPFKTKKTGSNPYKYRAPTYSIFDLGKPFKSPVTPLSHFSGQYLLKQTFIHSAYMKIPEVQLHVKDPPFLQRPDPEATISKRLFQFTPGHRRRYFQRVHVRTAPSQRTSHLINRKGSF